MTGSLPRARRRDEEPAHQHLVDLLRRGTGVGGIVEASDGLAAVRSSAQPDLFLDVQMPESTDSASSKQSAPRMTLTVFVTPPRTPSVPSRPTRSITS